MKMLTVSLLVCAMMALTRAAAVQEAEPGEKTGPHIPEVKSHMVKWSSSCSSGWTGFRGRCFLYVPTPMTWANAERHCQYHGGNLASVQSFNEQHLIQSVILSVTHDYPLAWLGGSDAQQEGTWFWSDGKPFRFNYWNRGQPDNLKNQDYLLMNFGDQKKFDDQPCSRLKPFVCATKP
ncbi:ladderlectin-like isoform X2 [Sebastes fasciatus]|uniref:ladderlectin-like isoform X2 n=1 Tax=Sebastes fasciatus TaxID=394691 RepID=UPI003D9F839B